VLVISVSDIIQIQRRNKTLRISFDVYIFTYEKLPEKNTPPAIIKVVIEN
jgi:hypothetical protein